MRGCSREEQYVATALLFQQDPDAFADGTAEQQSDAEAEWNSTTRDGKLTRLCESPLNYLCAKSWGVGLFSVLAFWGPLALLACPPRLSTALRSGFALTRLRLLAHSPGVRV